MFRQLVSATFYLSAFVFFLSLEKIDWSSRHWLPKKSSLSIYRMEQSTDVSATLQDMGIRAKNRVLAHLLLENAYENNLLPDISECDYLRGHLGTTSLRRLSGLPAFVDDIFVYGYVSEEDIFRSGGKPLCKNAKGIVSRISMAAKETFLRFLPTSVVHTVCKGKGQISSTVADIERRIEEKTLAVWKKIYNGNPGGIFVAKVDTSELAIEDVDKNIEKLARLLGANGYGIYSIDYTQDFSGTLDRKRLVEHLLQGEFELEHQGGDGTATILDNTNSVGEHVCTWVADGTRTKIYNKIVSNFEAGDVKNPIGAKLAEYVDCPNEHLRKTFLHPDVQKRGCTRIEISIYGRDFSKQHTNSIETTMELLGDVFVVQPPKMLWQNLSAHLDRCLVVSSADTGEIFLAWYCHTQTRRIAGVRVRGNRKKWEESILWTIAEFGFRRCPIFRIDILSLDPIEMAPLRCYTKDAPTVLAESTMPMRVHKDAQPIDDFLPPTDYVEWVWRRKKPQSIGVEKSTWEIFEISSDRKVSFLSKRKREKRMRDIEDALEGNKWAEKTKVFHDQLVERREELQRAAKKEKEAIEVEMRQHRQLANRLHKRAQKLYRVFCECTPDRLERIPPGNYRILGYKRPRDICLAWPPRGHRFILRGEKYYIVWAKQELLDAIAIGKFEDGTAIPGGEIEIEIASGRIQKIHPPAADAADLEKYHELLSKLCEIPKTPPQRMLEIDAPPKKECVQALYMQEGDYQCWQYAKTTFRNKERTILYLEERCKDCVVEGCTKQHTTTPVWGHFLQEECQKIDWDARPPLYCNIGRQKTTASKKKCRLVYLSIPSPPSDGEEGSAPP